MTLAINDIHSQLAQAQTPKQTRAIEAISKSAIAYADEQNDYELFMKAWHVYLMARRKTTELVRAELSDNIHVTTADYGFTSMQWSRRLKELAVPQEQIDAYFDKLVSNGWQPSIAGMLRESSGDEIDRFARAMGELRRGANTLLQDFPNRLAPEFAKLLKSLLVRSEAE